jgi:hypothetical protein
MKSLLSMVLVSLLLIGGCGIIINGCSQEIDKKQKQNVQTNQEVVKLEPKPAKIEEAAVQNDLQVEIQSVKVEPVTFKLFTTNQSRDPFLIINLKITNNNPTKIIDFQGWAAKELDFDRADRAQLQDENQNFYKRVHFGLASEIEGQVANSESIYPNKSISDVLIFEPPTDSAQILTLKLPAKQFGGKGMLEFQITRDQWDQVLIAQKKELEIRQQFEENERKRKEELEERKQAAEKARWRNWTSGKFSVYAKFLRGNNGNIYLQKKDGKEIKVKKDLLSSEDQKWINQRGWEKI